MSYLVRNAAKAITEKGLAVAAAEFKKSEVDVTDTAVSVDGRWWKKGFTSMNGCCYSNSSWKWQNIRHVLPCKIWEKLIRHNEIYGMPCITDCILLSCHVRISE